MSSLFEPTNLEKPLGGRYKIIGQLGAGGFGHTFLAEDVHLPHSPRCVVKQLKPKTRDDESLQIARRLFDTEAKVLGRLGDHNQIPRLLAHFEENQEFYLVQELIEGEPLSREIASDQSWPEDRVIALLEDLLEVLAFVHEQNVIHRDIKPSNLIRRRSDNKIVLIDFGAVKQVSTQTVNPQLGQATSTICIGTGGYMPNEQLAGHPRFSSDLYALGMVGIQALTGVSPKHLTMNLQTGEIDWHVRVPQVSRELATFLDNMVRYDFRDRYSTAVEALEVLRNLSQIPLDPHTDSSNSKKPLDRRQQAQDSSQPPSTVTPPKSTQKQSKTQKQSLNVSSILAVLVSVVVTFVITKTFLPRIIENTIYQIIRLPGERATPSSASPSVQPSTPSKKTPSASPTPSSESQTTSSLQKLSLNELLSYAERLRKEGKYPEAIAAYDQAIVRDSTIAEAHWGRCYSFNQLEQPTTALEACDRALTLKPDYPEALSSKGFALDQQQNHQKALESSDQAKDLDPKFAEAWNNQGVTLLKLNRPGEAITAFDKATTINPKYVEAWANRGAALWRAKRYDDAIASLDTALKIDPDNESALKLRRQVREQLGR
ncbi:MAG: serine/threonine-protein kinase [Coleofasciculus sp. S288]|nr:serine/threonine-protein kinase [Coleofasciculus sp. S288]